MTKTYTINQLGRLAGVSVRALHHYDEIGLLKPAFTGENRYRTIVHLREGATTYEALYSGLVDVYEHSDFRVRHEAIVTGFADYLTAAMRSCTRRQEESCTKDAVDRLRGSPR